MLEASSHFYKMYDTNDIVLDKFMQVYILSPFVYQTYIITHSHNIP